MPARGDRGRADVVDLAVVAVEAEQQRREPRRLLLPAHADDDAVRGLVLLDLDDAVARAGQVRRARAASRPRRRGPPTSSESSQPLRPASRSRVAGESVKPVERLDAPRAAPRAGARAPARRPRAARRRRRSPPGSRPTSRRMRLSAGCRRICIESKSSRPSRAITISPSSAEWGGSSSPSGAQLGEVAQQRPLVAAPERELAAVVLEHAAEAVPLRLVLPAVAVGQLADELGLHRREGDVWPGHRAEGYSRGRARRRLGRSQDGRRAAAARRRPQADRGDARRDGRRAAAGCAVPRARARAPLPAAVRRVRRRARAGRRRLPRPRDLPRPRVRALRAATDVLGNRQPAAAVYARKVRRVVVTGLGAVTPIGNDAASTWEAAVEGAERRRLDPLVRRRRTTRCGSRPRSRTSTRPRSPRRRRCASSSATSCSRSARRGRRSADAGLDGTYGDDRVGIVFGTAIGGFLGIMEQAEVLRERGPARVSPNFLPNVLVDSASGQLAISLGLPRARTTRPCRPARPARTRSARAPSSCAAATRTRCSPAAPRRACTR